eukprot:COSAG04_NODE_50_length_31170_cov_2.965080_6_plen_576_part_00
MQAAGLWRLALGLLALGLALGRAAAQTYSCPHEGQRSSSDDCWALGGLGARRQACECPLCPAGRHANGGAYDSACTFCQRGSFRAAETLGGCEACGVGQISDGGVASCSWTTELVVGVSVAALGLCMIVVTLAAAGGWAGLSADERKCVLGSVFVVAVIGALVGLAKGLEAAFDADDAYGDQDRLAAWALAAAVVFLLTVWACICSDHHGLWRRWTGGGVRVAQVAPAPAPAATAAAPAVPSHRQQLDMIAQFASTCGVDTATARERLRYARWDMRRAVNAHFEAAEDEDEARRLIAHGIAETTRLSRVSRGGAGSKLEREWAALSASEQAAAATLGWRSEADWTSTDDNWWPLSLSWSDPQLTTEHHLAAGVLGLTAADFSDTLERSESSLIAEEMAALRHAQEDERERRAEEERQVAEAQRQKEAAAVEEFLAACANRMGRMSPALAELESSSSSDDDEPPEPHPPEPQPSTEGAPSPPTEAVARQFLAASAWDVSRAVDAHLAAEEEKRKQEEEERRREEEAQREREEQMVQRFQVRLTSRCFSTGARPVRSPLLLPAVLTPGSGAGGEVCG